MIDEEEEDMEKEIGVVEEMEAGGCEGGGGGKRTKDLDVACLFIV